MKWTKTFNRHSGFCPYFSKCAQIPEGHEQIWSQQCGNYQLLHWSCAKSNCAHSRSHTQNLTHSHTRSSRILGFFVADQRHLLEFWGGWSSRVEAAVPVKTHSGGTAHLGGHASHANLALFAHWGQTKWLTDSKQIYRCTHLHTNVHYFQSHTWILHYHPKILNTVCRMLKEPYNTFCLVQR